MIERVKLSKISSLYILAIGRLLWEILYLYNRPLSLFHPSPSIIMSVTWEDQTTSSASFSRIAISIEVEFKSIYSPGFSWGKVFKSEFKHQLKFVSFSLHATVQQKRPEFWLTIFKLSPNSFIITPLDPSRGAITFWRRLNSIPSPGIFLGIDFSALEFHLCSWFVFLLCSVESEYVLVKVELAAVVVVENPEQGRQSADDNG